MEHQDRSRDQHENDVDGDPHDGECGNVNILFEDGSGSGYAFFDDGDDDFCCCVLLRVRLRVGSGLTTM